MVNVNNNFQNKNTIFGSRDQTIRRADDIARLVNRAYPRISTSNIRDFKYTSNFMSFSTKIEYEIGKMRELGNEILFGELRDLSKSKDLIKLKDLSKLKAYTYMIGKFKMGNCLESAELANIAAKVNGIKDAKYATLWKTHFDFFNDGYYEKGLDHGVLYVENGKKPYIIDSWLGFADYLPNAIQRYKNEFGYHFNIVDNIVDDVVERVVIFPEANILTDLVNKVPQKRLRWAFPELKLPNKNKNIFQKIKGYFINLFKTLSNNL